MTSAEAMKNGMMRCERNSLLRTVKLVILTLYIQTNRYPKIVVVVYFIKVTHIIQIIIAGINRNNMINQSINQYIYIYIYIYICKYCTTQPFFFINGLRVTELTYQCVGIQLNQYSAGNSKDHNNIKRVTLFKVLTWEVQVMF